MDSLYLHLIVKWNCIQDEWGKLCYEMGCLWVHTHHIRSTGTCCTRGQVKTGVAREACEWLSICRHELLGTLFWIRCSLYNGDIFWIQLASLICAAPWSWQWVYIRTCTSHHSSSLHHILLIMQSTQTNFITKIDPAMRAKFNANLPTSKELRQNLAALAATCAGCGKTTKRCELAACSGCQKVQFILKLYVNRYWYSKFLG